MGASQSLWVLGSDVAEERQQRGLDVSREALDRRLKFRRAQLPLCNASERTASLSQIRDLEEGDLSQILELSARRQDLNNTEIIKEAARLG